MVASAALRYAEENTSPFEGPLAVAAAWTQDNTSAPAMMSGLAEARLLEALIVAGGARRVLEIGTFTAVGTLSMAAAVPADGRVTTLEVDAGDALETIAGLEGPFDLVYIDAWKADYPAYFDAVVPKLAERGVIVADNLFRDGAALDPTAQDEGTLGMREFASAVQRDVRVRNVLLTIGDGVMLAWRRPPDEQ